MRCDSCQSTKTKVKFTFPTKVGIPMVNRKRECLDCGHTFETIERRLSDKERTPESGT